MGIRVSFGKVLKAKTLLIARLQGFIRFVSHFCEPIGTKLEPFITGFEVAMRISFIIKIDDNYFTEILALFNPFKIRQVFFAISFIFTVHQRFFYGVITSVCHSGKAKRLC